MSSRSPVEVGSLSQAIKEPGLSSEFTGARTPARSVSDQPHARFQQAPTRKLAAGLGSVLELP